MVLYLHHSFLTIHPACTFQIGFIDNKNIYTTQNILIYKSKEIAQLINNPRMRLNCNLRSFLIALQNSTIYICHQKHLHLKESISV